MASLDTVNVRITVGGRGVAGWRLRLLGWCARVLGVPVEVKS